MAAGRDPGKSPQKGLAEDPARVPERARVASNVTPANKAPEHRLRLICSAGQTGCSGSLFGSGVGKSFWNSQGVDLETDLDLLSGRRCS